jgi:hypothetical protein
MSPSVSTDRRRLPLLNLRFLLSTATFLLIAAVGLRAADIPAAADLKSMTEETLTSFGESVKKRDFSSFYEDIAEIWQKQTSAEKLKAGFKDFLDKGIDLPSIVEEMDPIFDHPAEINADDCLVIKGHYPTKPNTVSFQLKYLKEEDDWKLVGIDVKAGE